MNEVRLVDDNVEIIRREGVSEYIIEKFIYKL
jgi:hypothetical protein